MYIGLPPHPRGKALGLSHIPHATAEGWPEVRASSEGVLGPIEIFTHHQGWVSPLIRNCEGIGTGVPGVPTAPGP